MFLMPTTYVSQFVDVVVVVCQFDINLGIPEKRKSHLKISSIRLAFGHVGEAFS